MIRTATEADAAFLAPRLRKADVREIKAATGLQPLQALLLGLVSSERCFSFYDDNNQVLSIGGYIRTPQSGATPGKSALVWLLASDEIRQYALPFRKCAAQLLYKMWADGYGLLFNMVDARNTLHLRWLRGLGARLHKAAPYGVEGKPFHLFTFTNLTREN